MNNNLLSEQYNLLAKAYESRGLQLSEINRVAPWHAIHRRRTLDLLHPYFNKDCSVLDIACGTGILASKYAPKVGHVTLTDILPSMIQLAKVSLEQAGYIQDIEYYVSDIENLPSSVLSRKYDVILITQALNFFENLSSVFSIAAACLAPGGVLHVDIDNPLRWIIIEALTGHLDNALAIATKLRDIDKNIIGANYWFHTKESLMLDAKSKGLVLLSECGICAISSLLHIFNQSSDFLNPNLLDKHSKPFLLNDSLNKLFELDITMETAIPSEASGWSVFQFTV